MIHVCTIDDSIDENIRDNTLPKLSATQLLIAHYLLFNTLTDNRTKT
jgi:hypothetical protein